MRNALELDRNQIATGWTELPLLLLLSVASVACGAKPAAAPQASERVSGLRLAVVHRENVSREIEAPGTVASVRTAQIGARTMGTVQQVLVREGDYVKQGQLLAQLDEREMASRQSSARLAIEEAAAAREEAERAVTAAQAQADVAQKTLERFRALREKNAVAPQEFDEVEAKQRATAASVEAARARQRQAQAAWQRAQSESSVAETVASYARIVAPFDGVVLRRTVEPGSTAMPGQPLLLLEDASKYRLEVMVSASEAAGIVRGSKARVRLDAFPEQEYQGTVAELEAGADPASQTERVRLDLPRSPAMRSGLFGRAWFHRGERQAIMLPRTAIIERGQLRGVYVADPAEMLRWRVITLGAGMGDRVEVLSGLGEGERIVLEPGAQELDGKRAELGVR